MTTSIERQAGSGAASNGRHILARDGRANQAHDRLIEDITSTWPGDDTFAMTFAPTEDVRQTTLRVVRKSKDLWAASTAYSLGDLVWPTAGGDLVAECTTAGTTGASEPTWQESEGETVTDNTATWTMRPASDYSYCKVALDAVNEAQAEDWLNEPTASASTDVQHKRLYPGTYKVLELTKDPADIPLSRQDFMARMDTWDIIMEGE